MLSIYVEKVLNDKQIKIEDKKDIAHILNVYRLKENDKLRIVDGNYEYITRISEITKKYILVDIIEKFEDNYSLDVNIDVALALIKNDAFSLAIQKLTEIGINKIIPTVMDRSVVKLNEKKDKWEKIVTETLKQCRGVKKTIISDLVELKNIDFNYYDKVIFVFEKSSRTKNLNEILTKKDKNILYIIGPEGGFSEDEIDFLNKFYTISLGNRILRAPTAAIYVGALISYIYI